jgi:antirestriction protein ArdC
MKDNVSQYVIKPLLAALENGELPFWTKPWACRDGLPLRGIAGKNYRGGNLFMLRMVGAMKGYKDPRWLGIKDGNKIGGVVRKGEKATLVWVPLIVKDKSNGEDKLVGFRYSNVFHVSQFDGLNMDKLATLELRNLPHDPIPACEEWVARLQPKMMQGVAAAYTPQTDTVCMPPLSSFITPQKYYKTLLHELGHWTGAESRCKRDHGGRFGSEKYGYEELVAEIFSLFASYELGLEVEQEISDSAAYIKGWMKSLTENPNWVPRACVDAEKAMRFCLTGKMELEIEQPHESEEAAA